MLKRLSRYLDPMRKREPVAPDKKADPAFHLEVKDFKLQVRTSNDFGWVLVGVVLALMAVLVLIIS